MIKRTLSLLLLGSIATIASADERYFTYTYDWFTPSKMEKELELGYTGFRGGGFFGTVELEYGITDRWMVAPYLLFEKKGSTTKFQGVRLEQRYRFGEFAFGKIMPAAYLEVQKENDEPWEIEGKLILSYMPNAAWIASANLIAEQELKSGEKGEVGYSVGVARIFNKFTLGAEAFGNWKENEHFWGPSVGLRLADRTKIIGTAGIPISRGGTSQFRILLGKEF
jgi:hypothetical protein